ADFNRRYSSQGFIITSVKRFTSTDGTNKYQVVWSNGCGVSARSPGKPEQNQGSSDSKVTAAAASYQEGTVAYEKEDYSRAIACFEKSLPIWRNARNREAEASTLTYIGGAFYGQNRDDKALSYYRQALP